MNRPSPNRPEPRLPALPKGGGAIQGPGLNWLPTGMTGEAALEMPLPISVGRGFDPSLSLSYRSTHGQGPFGLGWAVPAAAISRDTRKGVPAYTDEDAFIDPHGVELIPG
ncbi:SpvB/TcaC N-terminal domain-containing protein, partial [Pseudomonas gingeri]|uniref:SpvB/TcaC N-terminal domain-containing protein n=1 Tax=Pseudomonas gingeri TaxID=117681 RepID=UPI001796B981